MIDNKESIDPGLSAAERNTLRSHEAQEAIDVTFIEQVRFSTRIRNALNATGMKTIGEVRETSDDNLLCLQDIGPGSTAYLREALGLPSTAGVRPLGKKPA